VPGGHFPIRNIFVAVGIQFGLILLGIGGLALFLANQALRAIAVAASIIFWRHDRPRESPPICGTTRARCDVGRGCYWFIPKPRSFTFWGSLRALSMTVIFPATLPSALG